MTLYAKPGIKAAWAETGDTFEPTLAEVQAGWPGGDEPPSRQRFNWILNYVANAVRHLMQNGIVTWDPADQYPAGGFVRGSDGEIYVAVTGSTNQNPTTDSTDTYWKKWVPVSPYEVGQVAAFARTSAPTGWLKANGTTIGNAASGATQRANDDTFALYDVLWNNFTNTVLVIQTNAGVDTTRGVSASADFAAGKRMPVPDLRGEFIRGYHDGRTVDPDYATRELGAPQADLFKNHTHGLGISSDTGDTGTSPGQAGLDPYISSTPAVVTSEGGVETRPRNVAMLYCIKL